MSQTFRAMVLFAVIVACLFAVPTAAVIQEVTFRGTVATLNQPKNTLTLENPQQYGCEYPDVGNGAVCRWTPINFSTRTATVPDTAALKLFKPGDAVVGTNLGGAGDTWVALAKLYGSRPNEEFVTDIVGDARAIPTPLVGNYALDLSTAPDCALCSGTTCTAASSDVTITTNGRVSAEQVLTPGETLTFNGRNDGSSISVTFVKGQASSGTCPDATVGMIGEAQLFSDYIVAVTPPVGYGQVNLRTATTTRTDEALPTTVATKAPLTTTASIPAPATTAKSGSLLVLGVVAFGLVSLLFIKKRT